MSSIPLRKPYQGVLQILQFNWPQYLGAVIVIGGAVVLLPFVHTLWRIALLLAIGPAAFWMLASLAVSHYVYDRFPLYDLRWIERSLGKSPASWVNIHCGFDETSGLLSAVFPNAKRRVVNIYDPALMTESSIAKAQGCSHPEDDTTAGSYDALGCNSSQYDAAFLIFAAHELRRHDQRVRLFQEVRRLLAPGGTLTLIEHSRDSWNFLAFGPGFLHFFSKNAWLRAISDAGLAVQDSFRMTRFITVYQVCKRA